MGKNQEYAEQYAEYAMEQMRRYGIPASVTLAQGILESSNGESRLAQNENNHFGIKATPAWIAEGGRYGIYTDDRPNEKFCSYDSVGDSYEHHSRFLKENSRYAQCFTLSPDDYKAGQKASHRPVMLRVTSMPIACKRSSSRTVCSSMTGRSCRRWRHKASSSVWSIILSERPKVRSMVWGIRSR